MNESEKKNESQSQKLDTNYAPPILENIDRTGPESAQKNNPILDLETPWVMHVNPAEKWS